jgi:uncharacterized membrane protein
METNRVAPVAPERRALRMHWHAVLTHFPVSMFGATALFQLLHLFGFNVCFEQASNVTLLAGTISMGPALWSGWTTWKKSYRGAPTRVFKRKISLGFIMLAGSVALAVWRLGVYGFRGNPPGAVHVLYVIIVFALIVGAVVEGYYGGPLSHHR